MVYFCEKCKKVHYEDDLCHYIKQQIKENPEILGEAANFVNIVAQYHLVTSQSLNGVAKVMNKVVGTNIRYEGTHQFAHDIQVFNRLNVEAYSKKGYFNSPEAAKNYFDNATKGQQSGLSKKIVGSIQEAEWLRIKQEELQSLVNENILLKGNAKGVDGTIVNRFTGNEITRVSIKGASTQGGLKTGAQGIMKALKNEKLAPDETVFVTKGIKKQVLDKLTKEIAYAQKNGDTKTVNILTKAQSNLKIIEHGSVQETAESLERVKDKIGRGKAFTYVTANEVLSKAVQGVVIGAVVGLTVSSLTNYIRYRNKELTMQEAFINIGEDALKSALIGGAMGAITCFLIGGPVGFVAGLAIGIYLNATLTNILDEIFGKGAYREILVASGYIYGTSMNLSEFIYYFSEDIKSINEATEYIELAQAQTELIFKRIEKNGGFIVGNNSAIRLLNIDVSDQEKIDTLIEAANDIKVATEANFMHMKEKKWYNRLWEMITFSKDNEKVMAKNIATLAQIQDIIIKALLMASRKVSEVYDYVVINARQLERMANNQEKLDRSIALIKFGHDPRPSIEKMSEEFQFVIVSAVSKFAYESCKYEDNTLVQDYLGNLLNCCDTTLNPEAAAFDYNKINKLEINGHKLLANILCEVAVLLEDSEHKHVAFDEVVRYIAIASLDLEEIKNKVKQRVKLLGKDFIAAIYAQKDLDEDFYISDASEIEFLSYDSIVKKHEAEKNKLLNEIAELKRNQYRVIVVTDDGYSFHAASKLVKYLTDLNIKVISWKREQYKRNQIDKNINDTDKIIIIGGDWLVKEERKNIERLRYDKYGLRFGFYKNIYVLTAMSNEVMRTEDKYFRDYYNRRLAYFENRLQDFEMESNFESIKGDKQCNLYKFLVLEFIANGLKEFLYECFS